VQQLVVCFLCDRSLNPPPSGGLRLRTRVVGGPPGQKGLFLWQHLVALPGLPLSWGVCCVVLLVDDRDCSSSGVVATMFQCCWNRGTRAWWRPGLLPGVCLLPSCDPGGCFVACMCPNYTDQAVHTGRDCAFQASTCFLCPTRS
jgi:hypothetical protein